jgi:N-acetylglucosamine kinase-like BadF-type ATPase
LQTAYLDFFGVTNPRDLKATVYAPGFGARGFAALAPLVSRVAEAGDPIAQGVIAAAGEDLAAQVTAVVRRLDFGSTPIPVVPVGGAFEHVYGLRQRFTQALGRQCERATVRDPLLSPAFGAVILALRAMGGDQSEAIARLRAI